MRTFLFPPIATQFFVLATRPNVHRRWRATIGAAFLRTRGRRRKFGRTDLFRNREAKGLSQQDQISRTSALGQKADISRRNRHVRFAPESDISMECPLRTTSRRKATDRPFNAYGRAVRLDFSPT